MAAHARFFAGHVALWLPAFARDVRQASGRDGVFSRLACLLEASCEEEGRQLVRAWHARPEAPSRLDCRDRGHGA